MLHLRDVYVLVLGGSSLTAVASNVDPAVAVELLASVEAVLAAMLTNSHSNSGNL